MNLELCNLIIVQS